MAVHHGGKAGKTLASKSSSKIFWILNQYMDLGQQNYATFCNFSLLNVPPCKTSIYKALRNFRRI